MRCCICKSEEHKAIDCPLSWYRRPTTHRDFAPDDAAHDPAAPNPDAHANPDPSQDTAQTSSQRDDDDVPSTFSATPTPSGPGCTPMPEPGFHLGSDGLLTYNPIQTSLPKRPKTVMSSSSNLSSGDFSLLTELAVSDDDDAINDDNKNEDDYVDDDEMDDDVGESADKDDVEIAESSGQTSSSSC